MAGCPDLLVLTLDGAAVVAAENELGTGGIGGGAVERGKTYGSLGSLPMFFFFLMELETSSSSTWGSSYLSY